jgi:hypothetical protein
MSDAEEELRDKVATIYFELTAAADVLEAAERHLGASNWDFDGAAKRAARAVGDTELDADEMRELIDDMERDLKSTLEPLCRYRQDENATRATMMLGFMLTGRIKRLKEMFGLDCADLRD